MPDVKAIHFNTPKNDGKARCGRKLAKVIWREDIADCTCNTCLRLFAKDVARLRGTPETTFAP